MKNKKGFTLVELLAVIAILAVLVLLAMPNVLKLFNEAKKSSFIAEAQEIAKTSTSKYVKESLNGKRVSKISSEDDTRLDLSGGDVDYYLELDNKGNITFLEVSNDSFCLQTDKNYKDITKDDVVDGKCDPLNRLTSEERERIKKAKLAEEKYSKNEYLKTTTSGTTYLGVNNFDKTKIKKIYTVATNEIPENAISSWDVSKAQNRSIMMWELPSDTDGMFELYIGQEDGVVANENSSYLFYDFINAIEIDATYLLTSNVTKMSYMFSNYNSSYDGKLIPVGIKNKLERIIGIELFDTTKVNYMLGLFKNNWLIKSLDLSKWNTRNVVDMDSMFSAMNSLEYLNILNFNTEKVTTVSSMFTLAGCKANEVEINISNFDFSNVSNFGNFFTIYSANNKYKAIIPKNNKNGKENTITTLYGKGTYSFALPTKGEYILSD